MEEYGVGFRYASFTAHRGPKKGEIGTCTDTPLLYPGWCGLGRIFSSKLFAFSTVSMDYLSKMFKK